MLLLVLLLPRNSNNQHKKSHHLQLLAWLSSLPGRTARFREHHTHASSLCLLLWLFCCYWCPPTALEAFRSCSVVENRAQEGVSCAECAREQIDQCDGEGQVEEFLSRKQRV